MSRRPLGDGCVSTELPRQVHAFPRSSTWRLTALSARGMLRVFTARSPRVNALAACTRRSYSWVYKRRLLSIIDQFLLVMTRKSTKRTKPRLTSPSTLDQNRCNATQTDPNPTTSDENPTPLNINPRPSPRPVSDDSPCSMSSRESSLSNSSTSTSLRRRPRQRLT